MRYSPLVADTSVGNYCCDDVQDGVLTYNVYRQKEERPWIAQLVIPYLVFFAVACVVSLFTLFQKGKLLIDKFRRRRAASNNASEVHDEALGEQLDTANAEIRKIYCLLVLGAAEGAHPQLNGIFNRRAQLLFALSCRLHGWAVDSSRCVHASDFAGCRFAHVCTLDLLSH